MKVQTYYFNEIEISEEDIFTFEHGLPGFESLRRFALLSSEDHAFFRYLQSIEDKDVVFLVIEPFLLYSSYEFDLPKAVQDELKIQDEKEIQVLSIITMSGKVEDGTINLMAPIILNCAQKLGKQIILHDSAYRTKHPLSQSASTAANGKE